jgi:hypothetical protein
VLPAVGKQRTVSAPVTSGVSPFFQSSNQRQLVPSNGLGGGSTNSHIPGITEWANNDQLPSVQSLPSPIFAPRCQSMPNAFLSVSNNEGNNAQSFAQFTNAIAYYNNDAFNTRQADQITRSEQTHRNISTAPRIPTPPQYPSPPLSPSAHDAGETSDRDLMNTSNFLYRSDDSRMSDFSQGSKESVRSFPF